MSFDIRKNEERNYISYDYIDKCKLPSGMTIKIEFQETRTSDTFFYNVYLITMHKRKQEDFIHKEITGKDGIRGLLWARQKIIEFEETILEDTYGANIIVYAWWLDNRRRNVYGHALKRLGYNYGQIDGHKVLLKKVRAV